MSLHKWLINYSIAQSVTVNQSSSKRLIFFGMRCSAHLGITSCILIQASSTDSQIALRVSARQTATLFDSMKFSGHHSEAIMFIFYYITSAVNLPLFLIFGPLEDKLGDMHIERNSTYYM